MFLANLFGRRKSHQPISRRSRQRATPRKLQLEGLEDRCVLSYTITDLTLPGFESSYATDVNTAGQVVGYARDAETGTARAFLWQNGALTDLGTLGGTGSKASGINDAGQVVGTADTGAVGPGGDPIHHAFLWQNGVMTDLGTLGGQNSGASDINALGQVVGAADTADGSHAFLWQQGQMTDLKTNGGASAVNDAGQVVGSWATTVVRDECYLDWELGELVCYPVSEYYEFAYLWQSGVTTDLGGLGGNFTAAADINGSGQVVGRSLYADYTGVMCDNGGWGGGSCTEPAYYDRAFLWQNGVMQQLATPTEEQSGASAINDAGQVVGWATANGTSLVTLWSGGGMVDLNQQIPPGSGWTLQAAWGIGNGGHIVGYGTTGGQTHAYLLTPATIPAVPTLTIGDVQRKEGNSGTVQLVFTVSLSGASDAPVTVNFATADGTARLTDNDYLAASGILRFAAGETRKTITVQVKGDKRQETNEVFYLNLTSASGAILEDSQGTGTIVNDDAGSGKGATSAALIDAALFDILQPSRKKH